ncbi:GAP1-N2 domain-containing protein [Coraliomargarita sp. W4R72]
MADQLIFTSSVTGIKPGASGYCSVLRSPGIRPALEQALEKISVFEHGRCNQGRMVYTYRKLDIRDKAYFVLSRISDAGKDYTGRTNFLAHHLAFAKEELPDVSPADLLLHWPNWCQQWAGDPREEPVDTSAFDAVIRTQPPVRLWKEQAAGVDGAVKLASDTGTSFILRSNASSDESLLQLIAEAFAVRTKFNKSSAYAWTTTFSVGLAVTGSAKSFKWLVLRASDDYSLSGAGTVLDLDTTLAGASSSNEELIAIAKEGQFRPPPKPIPLTQQDTPVQRSVPIQGGRTSQQPAATQRLRLGRGGAQRKSQPIGHTTKVRSKNKVVFALLACALILILSAVAFWLYQHQKKFGANEKYEQQLEVLISMHDTWRLSGQNAEISVTELEYIFEKMREVDGQPDGSFEDMISINWDRVVSKNYPPIERQNADNAFQELREYVLNHHKKGRYADSEPEKENSNVLDVKNTHDDEDRIASADENIGSVQEPKNQKAEEVVAAEPLDLHQYSQITLRLNGEEIKTDKNLNAEFEVALISNDTVKISKHLFTKSAGMTMDAKSIGGPKGAMLVMNGQIPDNSKSYAVVENPTSEGRKLILIVGEDWPKSVNIGEFELSDSSPGDAISTLEAAFNLDQLELHILDKKGIKYSRKTEPEQPLNFGRSDEIKVNHELFTSMAKDSNQKNVTDITIEEFEKWASEVITDQLKARIQSEKESIKKSDDKKDIENAKVSKLMEKTYGDIIGDIGKEKTISSYFKSYDEHLAKLSDGLSEIDDSDQKSVYNKTVTRLTGDDLRRRIQLKKEEMEANTYTVSLGRDEWDLVLNDKITRKASELSVSLEYYLNTLENEETRTRAQLDYAEFFQESRPWKSIVFKRPDGQVVATVQVK